ncbi:hypothetical protein CLOP_g4395, partial [Closterium sp. NIES-67]
MEESGDGCSDSFWTHTVLLVPHSARHAA